MDKDGIWSRLTKSIRSLSERGALYILGGSFLMKIAAFFGSIVLVRVMSKTDYGVLGYMENLYTYAHLFAGLGLNNAVFRYVVLKEDAESKAGVIEYVVRLGTAFNLVLTAALCVVAYVFPHKEAFSVASYLLPVMLLALPLHFLFDTGTFSLRALFDNHAYAGFAVLAVVLIWSSKVVGSSIAGLFGAVLSWPATYALMSAFVLLYVKKRALGDARVKKPPKEERSEMLSFSLQYMVTNGLWAMFLQNDMLLLGMLTGSSTVVATYKVAYAIPAAMSILSASIGTFVAPYFVRNEANKTWVWKNYLRVLAVSVVCLGVLTIAIAILCEPVVLLLYGEQYLDAVPVMRVLLAAVFLSNAVRYTAANLLAAMGRVRVNLVVSAVGMVAQIMLDFNLIPKMGMMGAGICSVLVYTLMSVAVTAYFWKLYGPWTRVYR